MQVATSLITSVQLTKHQKHLFGGLRSDTQTAGSLSRNMRNNTKQKRRQSQNFRNFLIAEASRLRLIAENERCYMIRKMLNNKYERNLLLKLYEEHNTSTTHRG